MSATTSRDRWDSYHRRPLPITVGVCEALAAGEVMKAIAWRFQVSLSCVSAIAVRHNLARRCDAGIPRPDGKRRYSRVGI